MWRRPLSIRIRLANLCFWIVFCLVVGGRTESWAATLKVEADGLPVYTGPGERYRILTRLPIQSEVQASAKITSSDYGRFYRVLVSVSEKQKVIGFIPVTAAVRLLQNRPEPEDLEKYGAVALTRESIQATYAPIRDGQQLISIGYMNYLTTGFYLKGSLGQWLTPTNSNAMTGLFELGNDSLLAGSFSGFVTYGLGLFIPPSAGQIFAGSQRTNALMQASLGVRYNLAGFASFSLGALQVVAFNANNSLVNNGVQLSIEVGL